MTAKLQPRITTENRTRLETVIPLDTPYLVFLDPSDICNGKCSFCPSSNPALLRRVGRKPQLMAWDVFVKVIDDLCALPQPIKTLRLYKDGEPLLNPRFTNMVRHAQSTGRFLKIDVTTNGLPLNRFLTDDLVGCGLDEIWISVPWEYTDHYREMVRDLYEKSRGCLKIHAKYIEHGDGEYKFLEDFKEICDTIFVEHLAPCWPGMAVEGVRLDVGIYGQPVKQVQVCPYLFYSAAINSDGRVSVCFLDWKHTEIIGDLKKESFSDIWNGKFLRDYRIMHLTGARLLVRNCANCGQLEYGAPDDIDQYAQEILGRLK